MYKINKNIGQKKKEEKKKEKKKRVLPQIIEIILF